MISVLLYAHRLRTESTISEVSADWTPEVTYRWYCHDIWVSSLKYMTIIQNCIIWLTSKICDCLSDPLQINPDRQTPLYWITAAPRFNRDFKKIGALYITGKCERSIILVIYFCLLLLLSMILCTAVSDWSHSFATTLR